MATINNAVMKASMGKCVKDEDKEKVQIEREVRTENNFITRHLISTTQPKRQHQLKAEYMPS
jgi:hypothetical protein